MFRGDFHQPVQVGIVRDGLLDGVNGGQRNGAAGIHVVQRQFAGAGHFRHGAVVEDAHDAHPADNRRHQDGGDDALGPAEAHAPPPGEDVTEPEQAVHEDEEDCRSPPDGQHGDHPFPRVAGDEGEIGKAVFGQPEVRCHGGEHRRAEQEHLDHPLQHAEHDEADQQRAQYQVECEGGVHE